MRDDGRDGGRRVLADRAHRRVDQGVHQLALALAGLADHDHPQLLVEQLRSASADAVEEIRTPLGGADVGGVVQYVEPGRCKHAEECAVS
ncbi:hypothetical protein GCM10017786_35720 [Amycolatopsis deserti]|uniref:Uncharacterized protein n=1 Tax=Amycolatopsis deserti TaxID=185696 RepID=A0ABQ3IZU4_9PSEU|nr:hypothetical protein GCM10017786_35720 [Amycolatopsis deserti]